MKAVREANDPHPDIHLHPSDRLSVLGGNDCQDHAFEITSSLGDL